MREFGFSHVTNSEAALLMGQLREFDSLVSAEKVSVENEESENKSVVNIDNELENATECTTQEENSEMSEDSASVNENGDIDSTETEE